MDTKSNLLDQPDLIAANEKLTADLAAANSLTATEANRANVAEASLATATASYQSSIQSLTKENTDLQAENAQLKADMADFNKRVAAEVAKAGIRKEAIAINGGEKAETEKKATWTEKAKAAKK